jgi:hypothetical protein
MRLLQAIVFENSGAIFYGLPHALYPCWRINVIENGIYSREAPGTHDFFFIQIVVRLAELRMPFRRNTSHAMVVHDVCV